jgi:multiple sugar transport system ATP-binding protein
MGPVAEGLVLMATITFDKVTRRYPGADTLAVNSLDLEIGDGEFLVLVGPSGCGKSTALRMLAGLEHVSSGAIRIGERDVTHVPPKERDIAMVFQNYALYPHMTVFDNMAFALKLRRVPRPRVRERVDGAADILDLVQQLTKKPGMLSGGQRQRVAMGRAIVREPQAFLMDEPLSNLDAKLRVQMRAEIARIQRDLGVTTLYVTHDQIEAMTLGDRVAVLRQGVLQQVDTPQQLFEQPRNLFVAGFIGSPAMNLVEAVLERSDGTAVASFGSHRLRVPEGLFALRPALERYVGRQLVLGIRPDDFEDASLVGDAPADARMPVEVDLCETLGREVYVHFRIDSPPVLTEDIRELAADTDLAAVEALEREATARKTRLVALVSAKTSAREGRRVELAVDTSLLHFFDRETGESIYDDAP